VSEFVLLRVQNTSSVVVTLEQYNLKGKQQMRSTFNIKLQVDIGQMDDARREAYINLVKLTAKQYYGQAAMIASSTPIVSITSTDRRSGEVNIPVFEVEGENDDE
jgi:hypothetical protein